MTEAKLNQDRIATVASDIIVFNFDGETREYISSSVEYLAVGVGIPANACIDKPGERKDGYVICRKTDLTAWEYVVDHRGETVYSTDTGEAITVNKLGDYPIKTTIQARATPFDIWSGNRWETDTSAQRTADVTAAEQKKASLLAKAQAAISLWQTELQLGVISDDDKASLINWLAYIRTLQAINAENAPGVNWPEPPAEQAS